MSTPQERFTAALVWRCYISTAASYLPMLEMSGNGAAMVEQAYKIAPGGLKVWARERIVKCLELASEQWVLFEGDSQAVQCANAAGITWLESLALVAVQNGTVLTKIAPGDATGGAF